MPNNTYVVRICMKNPSFLNGIQSVQVEGLALVDYETLTVDKIWVDQEMCVEVTDGPLTVTFAGSDVPARLCWIEIIDD